MIRRTVLPLLTLTVLAAGCGGEAPDDLLVDAPSASPPATGICLAGDAECDDIPLDPDFTPDLDDAPTGDDLAALDDVPVLSDIDTDADEEPGVSADDHALVTAAEALLGQSEDDALASDADVRVGRHGDEQMALIENYVVGRMTIATEDDGTGTFRVVEVTVELTDAPVTVPE